MINGDSSKGTEFSSKKRRKNEEFSQSIARIAVAQICESVGLHGFQQSALDTLSDITCKYIQNSGKTSNFYANLAGRTDSNVFDIINGLEDLGLTQGFIGASDNSHSSSESGIIKEISQYVSVSEEVEFAYSVPRFPVIKERNSTPSFCHAEQTPPLDNIPPWLPCFPDPKTYISSNSPYIEQNEEIIGKIDQSQTVIGPPLLKLERRLVFNGGKEKVSNPFLKCPLNYGEKEVSLVSIPARFVEEDVARNLSLWAEHVSSWGTVGPVIQDVKSNDLDANEGIKTVVVEKRPAVKLKFYMGKKSLPTAKRRIKIGNVDMKDDKKRAKEDINGKWIT